MVSNRGRRVPLSAFGHDLKDVLYIDNSETLDDLSRVSVTARTDARMSTSRSNVK